MQSRGCISAGAGRPFVVSPSPTWEAAFAAAVAVEREQLRLGREAARGDTRSWRALDDLRGLRLVLSTRRVRRAPRSRVLPLARRLPRVRRVGRRVRSRARRAPPAPGSLAGSRPCRREALA